MTANGISVNVTLIFSLERYRAVMDAYQAGLEKARVAGHDLSAIGVKDPAYPDTRCVTELVAADTVNTMPEATLEATVDHGLITGDTVRPAYASAAADLAALATLGISYDEVVRLLESEGVAKFEAAWSDLLAALGRSLTRSRAHSGRS